MSDTQSKDLTDAAYWNGLYSGRRFVSLSQAHPLYAILKERMPVSDGVKTYFEFGCCPGRFLALFGDLGYELSGVDYVAGLEQLGATLAKNGYRTGTFIRADATACEFKRKYDVVASFGFIEHFIDWKSMLEKQVSLVKGGGYLVVSTPNFACGFQRLFNAYFNKTNFEKHNVDAMDLGAWESLVKDRGFVIEYSGYVGRFNYILERGERGFLKRILLKMLSLCKTLLVLLLPNNSAWFAPHILLLARRKL